MTQMTVPLHLKQELDSMIEEIVAEYNVSGLAISITDCEKTLDRMYWGYADVDKQSPLDENTIFGMASISKSFTAIAIMQLVERGVLDLHKPVQEYLPEFSYPGEGDITLSHLLSHMAGYPPLPRLLASDLIAEVTLPEGEVADPALSTTLITEASRRLLSRLSQPPVALLGLPGEYLSYSNDGFAALGEVVRRHGGYTHYVDYLKAEILDPIGMLRSRCDVGSLADEPNKTMLYYDKDGERHQTDDWHSLAFALPGEGTLKSTLSDMERYLRCYLNGGITEQGNRVLSSYSVAEMQKPRIRHSHQRYYAYGLMASNLDELTACGHGGSLPGVSSDILWSNDLQRGIVVLCNTSNVPVARISAAVMKVLNDHSALEPRIDFQDRPWDQHILDAAQGTYVSGEGSTFVISVDDEGKPQLTLGKETFPIRPVLHDLGLVQIRLNSNELRLFSKNGAIWAIGYGGRMIPRQPE